MRYKEYATLFFQSIKNKNMPTPVKIILGIAIAYIIVPVDFIPDVGFPVGILDDTIVAAVLIGIGGRIIYNKIKAERSGQIPDDDNVIDL